jgi:hypothetical protein
VLTLVSASALNLGYLFQPDVASAVPTLQGEADNRDGCADLFAPGQPHVSDRRDHDREDSDSACSRRLDERQRCERERHNVEDEPNCLDAHSEQPPLLDEQRPQRRERTSQRQHPLRLRRRANRRRRGQVFASVDLASKPAASSRRHESGLRLGFRIPEAMPHAGPRPIVRENSSRHSTAAPAEAASHMPTQNVFAPLPSPCAESNESLCASSRFRPCPFDTQRVGMGGPHTPPAEGERQQPQVNRPARVQILRWPKRSYGFGEELRWFPGRE